VKQVVVGTYEMGYECVQLVLREGNGGEFWMVPGDIDCPRIKIGADQEHWKFLLVCLLHEAGELAAARLKCRYTQTEDVAGDVHSYFFNMTHPQFSEMQGLVAEFVANCWDDLGKAWKKWKPSKKDKK
jgi:hypothetical protein